MAGTTGAALAEGEQKLAPVKVVGASGHEQEIIDAPASISVITAEELGKKSYTNVLDAVKNIPGVYMTGGGGMSDISVRGMAASYTMILVDGRPISAGRSVNTNGTDGGKQIGLPPLSQIERIEVIRGPMSSLYGSDAMGGVVNIITKKITGEWRGNVNTEWTHSLNDISNDAQTVDLMASGAIVDGLLGVQFTGSWQGTDESDYNANSTKSDASTPEGKNKEAGVKFVLTPNAANEFALGYNKAQRNYTHTPGKSIDATVTDKNGVVTNNTASHTRYEKDVYLLSHEGRYDAWQTSSYLQRDTSENISNTADSQKKETQTTFNTQGTTALGTHILTLGGQYRDEELINETNGLLVAGLAGAKRKMERWLAAVYAEMEWNLNEDLAITTGLRYNDDELFGSHYSPRLYGVYHLSDRFTLKGGISTGYKQPSLSQATEGFGGVTGGPGSKNKDVNGNSISRALMIGNKELRPETSTNYEFGFIFDAPERGLNTSLMLFQTRFDKKIAEDRYCESPGAAHNDDTANYACNFGGNNYYFLSSYKNIDKASLRGTELTLDYWLARELKLSLGYTYTHSKQESGDFKGQPLNKMPKHMANLGLDWAFNERLDFWAQYNYRGKTSDYLSRTTMENGTPAYGFIDVGMVWRITPKASAKLGLYNLANKAVTSDDYGVVLDGRRVNLGLGVEF